MDHEKCPNCGRPVVDDDPPGTIESDITDLQDEVLDTFGVEAQFTADNTEPCCTGCQSDLIREWAKNYKSDQLRAQQDAA